MDDSATIDKLLDERLRLIQIINAALLAGVVFFTGFVLFGTANDKLPATADQLTYAVVAFFFVMLLVWVFVPPRFADRQVTKIASGTWTPSERPPAPKLRSRPTPQSFCWCISPKALSVPHFSKAQPSSQPPST